MSEKASSTETEFYHRLRKTLRIWAGGDRARATRYLDLILAGPDLFMLLVRLSRDRRLSRADRRRLSGAVAYFINPADLVPELILGPPGLVDDVALAALVLHDVLETTDPSVVREYWEGDVDVLELVRQILDVADTMLGGPLWRRLRDVAEGFVSER
ncbi:MAG: DUF1232 domain-containing protein [Anaerolineae bacterium]|jgi:uncharacterized membrane protein YkvA (DUF1232 family)